MTKQIHIQDKFECTACHEFKLKTEFQARKDRPKGICSWCKKCSNKFTSKFWKNNPDKKRIKEQNWKSKNKEKLTQYWSKRDIKIHNLILEFKDKPCTDCGIKYHPCAMDFDHLDATKKVGNISSLSKWRNKTSELLEEISKCELVCSNCHRMRTYNRNLAIRNNRCNDNKTNEKQSRDSQTSP
jgi:hypothetical protein